MKMNAITKAVNNSLIALPSPPNISSMWNFGSLLGLCLITQILSGLFLALHYHNELDNAFDSVIHITRDVNYGWIMRYIHANGASLFFICIYMHIGRGIYYNSYRSVMAWINGVVILFLLMATAFLGYVLPWGQMSFWGATVITNLLSTIPYLGDSLVQWLWGGFSVSGPTLTRFFALHYILPLIMTATVLTHIIFLHETGSNNPLGLKSSQEKIIFHPYFTLKDTVGFFILLMILLLMATQHPFLLSDPENFNPASPLSTPVHIQPEWYYLFAYAILRSIPSKLGGVIALVLSVLILVILPITRSPNMQSMSFYPINQFLYWLFISTAILLTWIGARSVEYPYVFTGQLLTFMYFSYFVLDPLIMMWWDSKISTLP